MRRLHPNVNRFAQQTVGYGVEVGLDLDDARSAGAKLRRSGMTGPTFAAMRLQAGR